MLLVPTYAFFCLDNFWFYELQQKSDSFTSKSSILREIKANSDLSQNVKLKILTWRHKKHTVRWFLAEIWLKRWFTYYPIWTSVPNWKRRNGRNWLGRYYRPETLEFKFSHQMGKLDLAARWNSKVGAKWGPLVCMCQLQSCCVVILSFWCHVMMLSCCHFVVLSCCHCMMLSCCHGVMLSWCHGVVLSCCHFAVLSCCRLVLDYWTNTWLVIDLYYTSTGNTITRLLDSKSLVANY